MMQFNILLLSSNKERDGMKKSLERRNSNQVIGLSYLILDLKTLKGSSVLTG
jgi:hypothetical protein